MNEQTMKALVYEGPRMMNMRQLSVSRPSEDEVLIRIERVGICGSELSGYLGHNSLRKPPLVMGHEFSGSVAEVGDKVKGLKIGDRVTANPLISCGRCSQCHTGSAHLCPKRQLLGAHRPGAFAGYVNVPAKNVYVLDDHVSFAEGAFAEPFACAVHICSLLLLAPTDRLIIAGAGPIGLFTLQAAQAYGLHNIAVIDINEKRLEIAEELGAVTATNIDHLQDGLNRNGFDAAVDAVGVSATRQMCVQSVAPKGKVVFSGLHEVDSSLPINLVIRNETTLFGAFAYTPRDFEIALQSIVEGRVNLLPWTIEAPLENGASWFETLISGPDKTAKVLLTLN